MNSKPELTIAIVTKDRLESLKKCLDSIILQTQIPDFVMIIDNSLHQTVQPLIKKYQKKLPLIYLHEIKTGASYGRNCALIHCRTKYLAFTDDDCTLHKNWTINALISIKKSHKTFIIGKSLSKTKLNWISKSIYLEYKKWFEKMLKSKDTFALNQALDTKNIIFDFNKIKNLRFDSKFPTMEDIDFGITLAKCNLKGEYNSEMIVYHQENNSLWKSFKKTLFRGRVKKILTAKRGNFDKYFPLKFNFHLLKNIFLEPRFTIIRLLFSFGYRLQKSPQVTIVNNLDHGANQQRCYQFHKYLKPIYHHTKIYNSEKAFLKEAFNWDNLFYYGFVFFQFHFFQILKYKFGLDFPKQHFYYYLLLRGKIVARYLKQNHSYLSIIQYPEDIATIKYLPSNILYDSTVIYSLELRKDLRYSQIISELENSAYNKSTYVSFHWYTYFDLLHQLKIFPKSELILNWGTHPVTKTATHLLKPKIVYIGILNSPWVNPKLLIKLSSIYQIDIYSYQTPDPKIYPPKSINYCGFLKNINDLSKYQFGLITFSNNRLRNNGFSAKHLEYLSYGLPVFCPEWRQDKLLSSATISYNSKNFISQIKKYSQKKYWQEKHLSALKIAKSLSWSKNLTALNLLLDNSYPRIF